MKRLAITIFLLVPFVKLSAACHVITSTGSGTNTGADWNNACNGFSGSCAGNVLVRGDTYYVAGGSGGSYSPSSLSSGVLEFTTADSGTSVITIKAATIADHCTNTGYVQANVAVDGGAGQVIWTTSYSHVVGIGADYVTFDGNFSASDTSNAWRNPGHACSGTQCGFKFDESVANSFQTAHGTIYGFDIGANTNVIIRSHEMVGCGSTCGSLGITTDFIRASVAGSSVTSTHNYLHNSSQCFFQTRNSSGTVIEYNYLYLNYSHSVSPAVHGCGIDRSGDTSMTFAFNAIQDLQGTGLIDELAGGATTSNHFFFYGNIIWATNGNPNGIGGYDNGVVSCTNSQVCTDWEIYNNTIVNENLGLNSTLTGGAPMGSGSSFTVYNNLFYNSGSASQNGSCGVTVTCAVDYNYYSGTTHTAETHEQTTGVNPFVNWTSNTTAGFQLSSDTNAWTSLSSPYNVDMNGVTRTSSRGALQFVTGGVTSTGTVVNPNIIINGGIAVQ